MARNRRAQSTSPDELIDPRVGVPQDADLVDPLQIASLGLEEVEEEANAARGATHTSADDKLPAPLAVLSLAMDADEAQGTDEEAEAPRRGLFGRRGRTRAADPGRLEPTTADGAVDPASGEPELAQPDPDGLPLAAAADEPRVTTWAQDFAEQPWATGEWPAVKDDEAATGEAEPHDAGPDATILEHSARERRRGGRRRRKRGPEATPVAAADAPTAEGLPDTDFAAGPAAVAEAPGPDPKAFLGSYLDLPADELAQDGELGPVDHVVDEAWDR